MPDLLYYLGKNIEDYSKEELVEIVRDGFKRENKLREDLLHYQKLSIPRKTGTIQKYGPPHDSVLKEILDGALAFNEVAKEAMIRQINSIRPLRGPTRREVWNRQL
jgi:hypothetical protein